MPQFPALGKLLNSFAAARKSFRFSRKIHSVFSLLFAACLLFGLATTARAQNFADSSKWELGGHFAYLTLPYECSGVANCQPSNSGFGGNLTYNFSSWISLDSEMNFFPDNGNAATSQTGGQVTEGLYGLRVGPTTRRWGFYSVLRPGFVSFSRVMGGASSNSSLLGAAGPRQFSASLIPRGMLRGPRLNSATVPTSGAFFDRSTDFALNYGEAIEFRATKHAALRFDIGDTIVSYPGASNFGPFKAHNFQISQALVIRF